MTNPNHYQINEYIDNVDAVFVNAIIDTTNCSGSSLRLHWAAMMAFWRGYIFKNKNVIFTSFGDPYRLLELPFLKTYINAYIVSEAAAKAVVDACLGDIPFLGKNPINIPNVCERME